jgi:hypothetical protein
LILKPKITTVGYLQSVMNFSTQIIVTGNKSAEIFKFIHFLKCVITSFETLCVFVRFTVSSMNFVMVSFILRPIFCAALSVLIKCLLNSSSGFASNI